MGILKGGLAVTRFKCTGDTAALSSVETVCSALSQYRFREIEGGAEMSMGWSLFGSPFDGDHSLGFHEDSVMFDKYIAFCLRVDRKRIPGSVKKIEVEKALRAEKATNGTVSKERKLEIKETVLLRLLSRATAVPSAVEVVVDPEAQIVYISSAQGKAIELFSELFNSSFPEVELVPMNACSMVEQRLELGNQNPFAALERKDQAVTFLGDPGNMFLTWLWYRDGRDMGGLNGTPTFSLYLDRKLAAASEAGSVSVVANPAREDGLDVAKKAIAEGRRIYSAKAIAAQEGEIFFDLSLTNELTLSGIKLPKVETDADFDDIDDMRLATLILRMDLLKRVCAFVDAAYGEFLDVAMDDRAWAQEQAAIIEWALAGEV